MRTRRGFGTRYDDDGSGNHIQRLRDKPIAMGMAGTKTVCCYYCNRRVPRKGGATVTGHFMCGTCRRIQGLTNPPEAA